MQLLQGHVPQQSARLAVCAGLGHELLDALSQSGALVWLGCLENLLQDAHALGPHGILHVQHHFQERQPEVHSIAAPCRDFVANPSFH